MNMTIFFTLAVPVIAACLLVLGGKCLSFFMEQPEQPFTRRFTRRVESGTLLAAALIITLAVVYQMKLPVVASSRTDPGPVVPSGTLTCVPGSITIDGSTALVALVKAAAQDYEAKCPHAMITVNQSSSATGLASVESGKIDIANSDISALPTQGDLIDHRVAVVIFTIVVSADINITNLTSDQLYGIFNGTITDWSKVGGPEEPITVFQRIPSSGTRTTFDSYILCGPETPDPQHTRVFDTTGQVATAIQQSKGAIGYVDLGTAVLSHLHSISIDGVPPVLELVYVNHYKFWNIEHMYTKGLPDPASLTNAFIQYMTNTPDEEHIANIDLYVNFNVMTNRGLGSHETCQR